MNIHAQGWKQARPEKENNAAFYILGTLVACAISSIVILGIAHLLVGNVDHTAETCHLVQGSQFFLCVDENGNVAYRPAIERK